MNVNERSTGLAMLFGEDTVKKIRGSKVLLVGAGGIGSEMLKELVMVGVGEIHLVDMDTIDLSNLNRQFLFGMKHIKQNKATVAAEVAAQFNPSVHIVPYTTNIMDDKFSPKWFRGFALAFNALDNAEARRHVNKMCVFADVPLIDAGTAGIHGQIQVIIPGKTECYDCFSHPAPVSFPICTIRSTPTLPVHAVVWAKSFLFNSIFGRDEDEAELDRSVTEENKEELEHLMREHTELSALRSQRATEQFPRNLLEKVYGSDIKRLLKMDTMWTHRKPPVPLNVDDYSKTLGELEKDTSAGDKAAQQDQTVWSEEETLQVLAASSRALAKRAEAGPLDFDKDDEDALNFVVAAANLRSRVFGLGEKSKFDIKQIAGNIIPAIATTNAIVSGFGVVEALKILAGRTSNLRNVNIWRSSDKLLRSERPAPPNKSCSVCGSARTTLHTKPRETLLKDVVEKFLKLELGYSEVSLVADDLIYDTEYDENLSKSLADLGLSDRYISVIDEDDRRVNLELYIDEADGPTVLDKVTIPLRPGLKKRRANDDSDDGMEEIQELEPVEKKPKVHYKQLKDFEWADEEDASHVGDQGPYWHDRD